MKQAGILIVVAFAVMIGASMLNLLPAIDFGVVAIVVLMGIAFAGISLLVVLSIYLFGERWEK